MLYLSDRVDRYIVSLSLDGTLDMKIIYQGTSTDVAGEFISYTSVNYTAIVTYNRTTVNTI